MYVKATKKLAVIFCIISLVLISAGLPSMVVSAKEKDGTFTVICEDDKTAVSGMEWNIYRIGKRHKNSNYYNLDGNFKNYKVAINYSDSDKAGKTAATLENYAVLDKIKPDDNGVTDKNGTLKFEGLKEGLYIASGDKVTIGNITYEPTDVLFEINNDIEGGNTGKNIVSYVKLSTTVKEDGDDNVDFDFTVKNIWDDNDNEKRPEKVKVQIYKDGELFIEVELSDKNNWTHNWNGSIDDEWRVKIDTVPDEYTVEYDRGETDFAVINTHNPRDPIYNPPMIDPPSTSMIVTTTVSDSHTYESESTTQNVSDGGYDENSATSTSVTSVSVTSEITVTTVPQTTASPTTTPKRNTSTNTGGKLPQTGQLWWPVFVLGAAGVVVLAYGIRVTSDRKRDSDE